MKPKQRFGYTTSTVDQGLKYKIIHQPIGHVYFTVIFDGAAGVENDHRSYSVKTLGAEFVSQILEQRWKNRGNVRVTSALTWLFHTNVIHDDADAITKWMKQLNSSGTKCSENVLNESR